MVKLLEININKYFNASLCSMSFFIFLVSLVLAIICPLCVVLYTDNAWEPIIVYYEQADVKYYDQMFLSIVDSDGQKFYSTMFDFNYKYSEQSKIITPPPLYKYEKSENYKNNLANNFKYYLNFYHDKPEEIKNIRLYFFFNYGLNTNVKGQIESLNEISINTPNGISYIKINGILNFKQKSPLDDNSFVYEEMINPINETISGQINENDKEFYSKRTIENLQNLYKEFLKRNYTTQIDFDYFIMEKKSSDLVQIEVDIEIPSNQKILYYATTFTKLKFFWIQFCALFLPIGVVIYFLLLYLYKNKIFSTVITSDLDLNKR